MFKSPLNRVQKLLCQNDTFQTHMVDVTYEKSDEWCSLKGANYG